MQFVWAKGLREEMNLMLAFVWKCDRKASGVALSICAAHAYRVWKNGECLGYGPARTAHGYIRKDSYSIETLDEGDWLVVEVGAYNVRCLSVVGKEPCFGAEICAGGETIVRSADFACYRLVDRKQKTLRFSFQRPFTESYTMQACRSRLYAGDCSAYPAVETETVFAPRILPRNVPYPTYAETVLPNPVERGVIKPRAEYTVWRDRAHEITDIFDGFLLSDLEEDISAEVCAMSFEPVHGTPSLHFSAGEYGVFSLPRTVSGFYKLRVFVEEACTLYLLFDEIDGRLITGGQAGIEIDFKRNDTCNAVKYELAQGAYELYNFEPYSVRHTRLCVTAGKATIERFAFVAYENPAPVQTEYCIQDEVLSKIVRSAQNTLAQNSVDILMDCPSRERAGWINDAFFSGRAEYALTGSAKAHRNLLEAYALSPDGTDLDKGMVCMCYPGDFPNHDFIPQCALWFILNVYEYNARIPDPALVALCKEKAYGVLAYFSAFENEYEFLEDLKGWRFIEWSAANWKHFVCGVNFPSNMLYSKALRCMGELYNDRALLKKSERIKARVCELSFNGEFFTDNAVRNEAGALVQTDHTTETCQYYAFFFGVADKKTYAPLYRKLKREFGSLRKQGAYPTVHPSNALIGFLLRLDLLRQDKEYKKLLKEVKSYYANMAKTTGTLWEHKDVRASLNHGFASYVAVFVLEALGIKKVF